MFFRTAWIVFRKDVTIEIRSRETLATTMFFALSVVVVFAFALVRDGRVVADAAAGILWIAIAFSGTLALGRTFERERYTDTLRALLLAPVDRPAIYVGKLLGILAVHLRRRVPAGAAGGAAVRRGAAGAAAPPRSRCWSPARSALPRSARCSPRCWCARRAATSCCR